ncbi:protein NRT1/ PTR FAMILY 5.5-like [Chenopodium quinoa]|uniref:protein NRT1/ PTR FAMILY 5.5-like n=1 Tax=Chenopodium quinoa TaxID=63459 RepID=UPI000B78CE6C|nr:protein NRT1/ PTR FAMILY 5.5-like [Chenopodium quinoa]XP_021719891.1 protein NRT1/ PTR FAMILY 5.5-like [Chenopodium quinoa]
MIATKIVGRKLSRVRYVSPVGVAVSMVFSILCCIAAAKVEARRLEIVKSHGLIYKPDERVPMIMFWLLPQFALLGALDGIREWSVPNLVVGQAPRSMLGLFNFISLSIIGTGYIESAVSVYVVGRVSRKVSGINWFQSTLNKSRLDKYYWVLAALSAINLVIYILVVCFYRFKDLDVEALEEPEFEETEDNIVNHME